MYQAFRTPFPLGSCYGSTSRPWYGVPVKSLSHAGDKAGILRRLEALQPDSRRRWGRMTPHQAICHLADSFRLALGTMATSRNNSLFHRTVLKWLALYAPIPWPPAIISTRPEIDQVKGHGTKPTEFEVDVAQLAALTELFSAPETKFTGQAHPLFGEMSRDAWLRWGYLHLDHHLRQFGV